MNVITYMYRMYVCFILFENAHGRRNPVLVCPLNCKNVEMSLGSLGGTILDSTAECSKQPRGPLAMATTFAPILNLSYPSDASGKRMCRQTCAPRCSNVARVFKVNSSGSYSALLRCLRCGLWHNVA